MEEKTLKVSRKLLDARADKKSSFTWNADEKSLGEGLHELTCTVSGSKKLVLVKLIKLPETEKDVRGMDRKDVLRFVRAGIEASRLTDMGSRLDMEIAKQRVSAAITNGNVAVAQEIIEDIEKSLVPMLERIGQEVTMEIKTSYVKNTYNVEYAQVIEILGIAEG